MMKFLMFAALTVAASAGAAEKTITSDGFESLQRLIRPQADESHWAKVPWETSLKTARERASRENKPILLWRSGGGDVLGRT
ncbi:MAG: hypothetical protein ACI8XO_000379 [Verrucomicrobiales bacterium]|jgi:hypothetical protein